MYKRALFCLLLISISFITVQQVWAEDESPSADREEILVIYPEEAVRRGKADNLSAIAQVMFSLRYLVDWVEAGDAKDVIGSYNKVIWVATADSDRMDTAILHDYDGYLLVLGQADGMESYGLDPLPELTGNLIGAAEYLFPDNLSFRASVEILRPGTVRDPEYTNGSVNIFGEDVPLVSGSDHFRYIPLIDYTTNFAKALLMQEFEQWFWKWDIGMHTWAEHLVIDAVYPFTDPYRLKEIVDYMVDLKMNFVISVMPIYEHADYPAMQRFCDVLRYAQANGGGIVLHSPIIQDNIDPANLARHLMLTAKSYLENGVYILAMEIPSEWVFDENVVPSLGRYRTLFLSELDAFEHHPVSDYDVRNYLELGNLQIVPALRLDETGISHIARCSNAVYVNIDMKTNEEIFSVFNAVKDAPIPMQSLWDMEQAVYFDDFKYLTWDKNTLIVNDVQHFNVYEPAEYDEKFDYKRNIYYRFVTNLANQNHFLIWMSGVVLVLFIVLVFQSRQQMHKRFLKKIPEPIEGKES